jgi:TPR repeat protein
MVAALALAGPVVAGPLEDATAAFKRGDYATELRLLQPLAQQGNAPAQYYLGTMWGSGRGVPMSEAESVKWYRLAAEQGYADAQEELGFLYFTGYGAPNNYAQAAKWSRLAAEQGNDEAQLYLSILYANGKGVPQDYVLAYMWANLSAAAGNAAAANNRAFDAAKMTGAQIAQAQKLSLDWKPTPPK